MQRAEMDLEPDQAPRIAPGGRRAVVGGIPVERTLPRPELRTVGGWCLVDRFGPVNPQVTPMLVPPHPHIGLHTVTWLLSGELLHRDSLGNEQMLRPGQVNVMTAGHGISHSEETPRGSRVSPLHGFQLWIAQPEHTRHGPSRFVHHDSVPVLELGLRARAHVFMDGALSGAPRVDSDLIGMDVTLTGTAQVPVAPSFEHAAVVADGEVLVEGARLRKGSSIHVAPGRSSFQLHAAKPARVLVLGGPPFPERLRMSWNFVARTAEELEEARVDWDSGSSRFGTVASSLAPVAAPPPRRRS